MNEHYRKIAYQNYAHHFGSLKLSSPALDHAVYQTTYTNLPSDPAAKIADLGCGRGEWLAWLNNLGYSDLTGFEFSEDQANAGSRHGAITIIQGDAITCLRDRESAFDVIHAKDLIEHLTKEEMIDLLEAALHSLKPGGAIWLLSYNAQAPLASATAYGDFTHEAGFTPRSLAQILRATGFEDISVRGIFNSSGSFRSNIRRILYESITLPSKWLLSLRHGRGTASEEIDSNTLSPDLFAVARKPLSRKTAPPPD